MAVRIGHHADPPGLQRSGTRRLRLLTFGVALTAVLVLSLGAFAPAADAFNPLSWPSAAFHFVVGGVAGGVASVAVAAFEAIIKHLFAPIAKFVTTELIGWLVAVPNFTQGSVAQLESTVVAMGGGLLGAVATIATLRYWVAGFAGGGDAGFVALEGLMRTVAAALCLAIWPWLFDSAVGLTNLFTSSLLGSGSVVSDTAKLLAVGLGAGVALSVSGFGLFVAIAIAVCACLLFLGLLVLKIVLSVSTVLVFVGMPIAIVLWPLLPSVTRLAMRAFAVCLAVPALWALCFAAFAAVNVNVLGFQGGGGVFDTLLQPLVAIVMLWLMLRLPFVLARIAMLGGGALRGGFVARAAGYAARAQIRDTVRQHVPQLGAGASGLSPTGGTPSDSRTAGRLRNAATLAGAAASAGAGMPVSAAPTTSAAARIVTPAGTATMPAGGAPATASGGGAGATGPAGTTGGTRYTPPATAQAHAAGQLPSGGLQTPGFREQDFQAEVFEARYRERTNPVSVEQAAEALRALPASTQRAVGELVAEHGAGAREHLAYQATGEWTAPEREALRTLAAATSDTRSRAVEAVLAGSSGRPDDARTDGPVPLRSPAAARGGGGQPVTPADQGGRQVANAGEAAASPGPDTPAASPGGGDLGSDADAGDPAPEGRQWVGNVDDPATGSVPPAASAGGAGADGAAASVVGAGGSGDDAGGAGNGTGENGASVPPSPPGRRLREIAAAGEDVDDGPRPFPDRPDRAVAPGREPRDPDPDADTGGGS